MSFLPPLPLRALRPILLVALAAGMSACGSFNRASETVADKLTLYRPEVVQGNFVSKEQMAHLQQGMTRLQVRDLLGTPLLTSVFHGDRWDYVFTMKRQGVPEQSYRLALFFKGDALDRFDGDEMPSETEFVERISSGKDKGKTPPPLEATEDQLARFPPAAEPAAAETPASAPQPSGSYPPLEPAS